MWKVSRVVGCLSHDMMRKRESCAFISCLHHLCFDMTNSVKVGSLSVFSFLLFNQKSIEQLILD